MRHSCTIFVAITRLSSFICVNKLLFPSISFCKSSQSISKCNVIQTNIQKKSGIFEYLTSMRSHSKFIRSLALPLDEMSLKPFGNTFWFTKKRSKVECTQHVTKTQTRVAILNTAKNNNNQSLNRRRKKRHRIFSVICIFSMTNHFCAHTSIKDVSLDQK